MNGAIETASRALATLEQSSLDPTVHREALFQAIKKNSFYGVDGLVEFDERGDREFDWTIVNVNDPLPDLPLPDPEGYPLQVHEFVHVGTYGVLNGVIWWNMSKTLTVIYPGATSVPPMTSVNIDIGILARSAEDLAGAITMRALLELNKMKMIPGFTLKGHMAFTGDDLNDIGPAMSAYASLAGKDVSAIIGLSTSQDALAVQPVAAYNKLPIISDGVWEVPPTLPGMLLP